MDLLVFTNGAVRDISGVNETTTCAQVVYALAHATSQKGRFVLVATFSDSEQEHRLSPNEKPYELLVNCSQKGVKVLFELRKIDLQVPPDQKCPPKPACVQNGHVQELQSPDQQQQPQSKNALTSSCISSQMELEIAKIKSLAEGRSGLELNTPLSPLFPFAPSSSCTSLPESMPKPPSMPHNTSVSVLGRREQVRRPPPPSYHKIIEERCNSLTRNNQLNNKHARLPPARQNNHESLQRSQPANSAFHHFNSNHLYEKKMSIEELKTFVEAQIQTIAAQRAEIKQLELTLSNDSERELVQLKKQHNNLLTVLNSLRNANWPKRVECEQLEAESLNTAIDAMKTAIENKRRELYQVLELQRTLELQYVFEGSQQLGLEDIELRDLNQIAYPQKLEAIS